jgi:ELWxxDGT repeat protein
MNHRRIISITGKSILILAVLVGGLGFSLARGSSFASAVAPEPYLVKDINPGTDGSDTGEVTNIYNTLLFCADDGVHGRELWKSDGTPDGTALVKDINPGGETSCSGGLSVNDKFFFQAYDGVHGPLTEFNGTLFFSAMDSYYDYELWKSDGTAEGTLRVKDINPGEDGSGPPRDLTNVNGTLFFVANDGNHGPALWKSDGTAAGTIMVKDIDPGKLGIGSVNNLTSVNGMLFFSALGGLWKSDGTATGTKLVKDIDPSELTNVNGKLFFYADDGAHGAELWKSDGTPGGTVMVKDINLEDGGSCIHWDCSYSDLTDVSGTLFLAANDGVHGEELWKSDGTPEGTVMVKDIYPGKGSYNIMELTNANGTLFFAADDVNHGMELWQSDGTAGGTFLVKDIDPGSEGSSPEELAAIGGTLFFSAHEDVHGRELWALPGAGLPHSIHLPIIH